jgi:NAD(P)-dependent dehydrogenase (short-subunit alcohol dehydrogenase family)
MKNSHANKAALVTGGTSGIGKATAIEFAGAGAAAFVGADVSQDDDVLAQ